MNTKLKLVLKLVALIALAMLAANLVDLDDPNADLQESQVLQE